MKYVQVVLSDSQAVLNAQALANSIEQNDDEIEREQLRYLADFFRAVGENPAAFPVKTPAMARALKKRVARLKGPAQPERPNARKRTQERKVGFQKRTRAEKRAEAEVFNAAREAALEAQAIEAAQEERERLAATGLILPGQDAGER